MQLTSAQTRWLQWLKDHGGTAYADGLALRAGNAHAHNSSAACYLHLIAKGAVEFNPKSGAFVITELGRRCLEP